MTDLPLFRRTDPGTSREAAASIEDAKTTLQRVVLAYAEWRGAEGFTDWELCEHYNNHGSTYRTRRNELTKKGLLVPTDQRRRLPSGRRAVVWVHRMFHKESNR